MTKPGSLRSARIFLTQHFAEGGKALVAVSGGIDSMVCAHLIASLRDDLQIKIALVYINHGLRGEAVEELGFVRSFAQKIDAPFFTEDLDLTKGAGVQERARLQRYRALERIAADHDFPWIVTAHNRDDQAETVLFRALRGAGATGLAGIPSQSGRILRPLLNESRKQIERYAADQGVAFIEDASNATDDYTRNRLRKNAIPALNDAMGLDVRTGLARLGTISALERDALDYLAAEDFNRVRVDEGQGVRLSVSGLRALERGRRWGVIRHALRQACGALFGFDVANIESVEKILESRNPSAYVALPGKIVAQREYDLVIFEQGASLPNSPEQIEITAQGTYLFGEMAISVELTAGSVGSVGETRDLGAKEAYLDTKRTGFPFFVRSWNPGDRMQLAHGRGTKKLADLFIDLKIPKRIRHRIPVVCDAKGVVWIPQVGVEKRVVAENLTDDAIRLSID